MAHFIGTIKGNKGEASRLGSKDSGMRAVVNGWNFGCEVIISHNKETDKNEINIWTTSGSNGKRTAKFIGTFEEK